MGQKYSILITQRGTDLFWFMDTVYHQQVPGKTNMVQGPTGGGCLHHGIWTQKNKDLRKETDTSRSSSSDPSPPSKPYL